MYSHPQQCAMIWSVWHKVFDTSQYFPLQNPVSNLVLSSTGCHSAFLKIICCCLQCDHAGTLQRWDTSKRHRNWNNSLYIWQQRTDLSPLLMNLNLYLRLTFRPELAEQWSVLGHCEVPFGCTTDFLGRSMRSHLMSQYWQPRAQFLWGLSCGLDIPEFDSRLLVPNQLPIH